MWLTPTSPVTPTIIGCRIIFTVHRASSDITLSRRSISSRAYDRSRLPSCARDSPPNSTPSRLSELCFLSEKVCWSAELYYPRKKGEITARSCFHRLATLMHITLFNRLSCCVVLQKKNVKKFEKWNNFPKSRSPKIRIPRDYLPKCNFPERLEAWEITIPKSAQRDKHSFPKTTIIIMIIIMIYWYAVPFCRVLYCNCSEKSMFRKSCIRLARKRFVIFFLLRQILWKKRSPF